jgi:hypothetical protein
VASACSADRLVTTWAGAMTPRTWG